MLGLGLRVLLWQPLMAVEISGQLMVDKQDEHIFVRMEYISIACIDQISDEKILIRQCIS